MRGLPAAVQLNSALRLGICLARCGFRLGFHFSHEDGCLLRHVRGQLEGEAAASLEAAVRGQRESTYPIFVATIIQDEAPRKKDKLDFRY